MSSTSSKLDVGAGGRLEGDVVVARAVGREVAEAAGEGGRGRAGGVHLDAQRYAGVRVQPQVGVVDARQRRTAGRTPQPGRADAGHPPGRERGRRRASVTPRSSRSASTGGTRSAVRGSRMSGSRLTRGLGVLVVPLERGVARRGPGRSRRSTSSWSTRQWSSSCHQARIRVALAEQRADVAEPVGVGQLQRARRSRRTPTRLRSSPAARLLEQPARRSRRCPRRAAGRSATGAADQQQRADRDHAHQRRTGSRLCDGTSGASRLSVQPVRVLLRTGGTTRRAARPARRTCRASRRPGCRGRRRRPPCRVG